MIAFVFLLVRIEGTQTLDCIIKFQYKLPCRIYKKNTAYTGERDFN